MDEESIAVHYSTSKASEAGDWNTTSMMAAAAAAAGTSAVKTMDDPSNIVGKTGAVIIVLIIIVGVTGNSQVLIVIAKCPQLHRSFNVFIASLSLTDLVYTVLMLPFYADTYIHRSLRYPVTLCRVLTHSGGCLVVASGLHLGLIAINRYVLIVHPHLYARISSGMAIAVQLFVIWMVSFFTVLPGIFGWQAVVGYSDQVGRCNYLRSESRITLSIDLLRRVPVPLLRHGLLLYSHLENVDDESEEDEIAPTRRLQN